MLRITSLSHHTNTMFYQSLKLPSHAKKRSMKVSRRLWFWKKKSNNELQKYDVSVNKSYNLMFLWRKHFLLWRKVKQKTMVQYIPIPFSIHVLKADDLRWELFKFLIFLDSCRAVFSINEIKIYDFSVEFLDSVSRFETSLKIYCNEPFTE